MVVATQIEKSELCAAPILRLKIKKALPDGKFETTMPVDVVVGGFILRLPIGCKVAVHPSKPGDVGGFRGQLADDITFVCLNGERREFACGQEIFFPNSENVDL